MVGQLGRGTTRTGDQLAATIGAPSGQDALRTGSTERAFERTNARRRRVGRQIGVAAFTIGSELQHQDTLLHDMLIRAAKSRRGQ